MKKIFIALFVASVCSLSLYADVKADGYSFCSNDEVTEPISYMAIRDAKTYWDALSDGFYKKGHTIKKGTVVKVYAIGKNCDNDPKTVFMNTDDVGFTGVKMNDFKKAK
ncbi:MAG: hypothetical protein PHV62_01075 [Sulfuricurvum sp.]|nr:hypothetical protein [Sulfuricurvum sp.]